MKKTTVAALALIFVTILSGCVTSSMIVNAVRKEFAKNEPTAALPDYPEKLARVTVFRDLDYGSVHKNGELDIIVPTETHGLVPVIFWIHGGAYIAGDKDGAEVYLVELADKGYAGVNINYQLAPEAKYPVPLVQIGEAYAYIAARAGMYGLDMSRVYFAGDSAGAQMAAQFTNLQVNPEYAHLAGIPAIMTEPQTIRGALLFCGPYDIRQFASSDDQNIARVYNFIAESYLGVKDWQTSPQAQTATIVDKVDASFPPAFITDGTVTSFPEHARALHDELTAQGVDSTLILYPEAELPHEYQFTMTEEHAARTFVSLVEFLDRTSR